MGIKTAVPMSGPQRVHSVIGPGVEVRYMGLLEIRELGCDCRWVDGYAVWVDGLERQPWMQLLAARREAKAVVAERSKGGK